MVLPTGHPGNHARVVEMRVAHEHRIHGRSGHRILGRILRKEAVVEEHRCRAVPQDHPESADFGCASEELEVHVTRPKRRGL